MNRWMRRKENRPQVFCNFQEIRVIYHVHIVVIHYKKSQSFIHYLTFLDLALLVSKWVIICSTSKNLDMASQPKI